MLLSVSDAVASGRLNYSEFIRKLSALTDSQLFTKAEMCVKRGEKDSALVFYTILADRTENNTTDKGKEMYASVRLNEGDLYFQMGDYANALGSYVEGLKSCEIGHLRSRLPLFYKNIGRVYCVWGDYEKGYEFYRKGYILCSRKPDIDIKRKLLLNLTGLCLHTGKTAEALKWHKAAVRLGDGGNAEYAFMIKLNKGMILADEGKRASASDCFKRLIDKEGRHVSAKYVCSAYQVLYRSYLSAGRTDSALFYIQKCWQLAGESGIRHMFVEVLKDYSDIYKKKGNKKLSQDYKLHYMEMRDSIFNIQRFDIARNAQSRYEMQKADREISRLHYSQNMREHTIRFQRILLATTLSGVIVVTILLTIALRQKRKLGQSYADLYALNRKLMDSNDNADAANRECSAGNVDGVNIVCVDSESGKTDCCDRKYKSSNLDTQAQHVLVLAIKDVMDNTEDFCSAGFSLERLAQLVGSNSKYVSQAINDTFKKNFSAYVNEYRVRMACRRLADSSYANYTIKAIGESLGFGSYASFISVFRKSTGLTPSQYQKMSAKDIQD